MASRFLKRDKVDVLARLPLFENVSKRELGQIAAKTVEMDRPAGTILTRAGRDGGLMFVILDGVAEVEKDGTLLGRLGPGDVIGELSLIDGQPRSADVRAVTDLKVLELAQDDFKSLVDSSPKFVQSLLRALSLRIRDMDSRGLGTIR
jgi:CPA1 family monovalent cation:H+ antiporter